MRRSAACASATAAARRTPARAAVTATSDGRLIAVSGSTPKMAERFLRSYGLATCSTIRGFATNEARVRARRGAGQRVARRSRHARWTENLAIIDGNQLTAVPVQTVADIERDPHWQARVTSPSPSPMAARFGCTTWCRGSPDPRADPVGRRGAGSGQCDRIRGDLRHPATEGPCTDVPHQLPRGIRCDAGRADFEATGARVEHDSRISHAARRPGARTLRRTCPRRSRRQPRRRIAGLRARSLAHVRRLAYAGSADAGRSPIPSVASLAATRFAYASSARRICPMSREPPSA